MIISPRCRPMECALLHPPGPPRTIWQLAGRCATRKTQSCFSRPFVPIRYHFDRSSYRTPLSCGSGSLTTLARQVGQASMDAKGSFAASKRVHREKYDKLKLICSLLLRVELCPGDYITISASRFPFANIVQSKSASDDWVNSISRTLNWNSRARQKSFDEKPKQ